MPRELASGRIRFFHIEIWQGHLSARRLRLDDSQWSALRGFPSIHGIIDVIIHNGARVHWITSYDGSRDANVGPALQLLQAGTFPPFSKSFVYVSGGLITDNQARTDEESRRAKGYD